jgi:hypothetical protein
MSKKKNDNNDSAFEEKIDNSNDNSNELKENKDRKDNEKNTIENWKEILHVPNHYFAGLKAKFNFAEGKKLSKDEFDNALTKFLYGDKKIKTIKNGEVYTGDK